jgi:hypothetical protein
MTLGYTVCWTEVSNVRLLAGLFVWMHDLAKACSTTKSGGLAVGHCAARQCTFGILTKWFSSTRLETRTKESNIYASVWVENPYAQ